MIHQIHVFGPDGLKIKALFVRKRRALDPGPILPMPRRGGNLADIDLRVKIGGKGMAVIAAITVQNIERIDLIEQVFARITCKDRGHARIKAAAQERHQARGLEPLLIGPLPAILEPSLIARLIIGRVHIMHTRSQTGLHDGQVLIG